MQLRYPLPIPNLPTRCTYSKNFDTQYAMLCMKRGFMALQNNKPRYITGALLKKLCHYLAIEPIHNQLQIITLYHQQQTQMMVPD